jgi:hypothetical protein
MILIRSNGAVAVFVTAPDPAPATVRRAKSDIAAFADGTLAVLAGGCAVADEGVDAAASALIPLDLEDEDVESADIIPSLGTKSTATIVVIGAVSVCHKYPCKPSTSQYRGKPN